MLLTLHTPTVYIFVYFLNSTHVIVVSYSCLTDIGMLTLLHYSLFWKIVSTNNTITYVRTCVAQSHMLHTVHI